MAFNVTLYSFTKRRNSTKIPSSGGTNYSCTLIDNTSLMNPTFKLSIASNPIGKNYCYVSDFDRYYFITDISSYQNFWYITCTCDVLGSFRTEIAAGRHYVLRSASSYDGLITDTIYPAKARAIEQMAYPAEGDPFDWTSNHSYVIGVVGEASSNDYQIGSLVYYHMDETALRAFITFLMDNVAGPDGWSGLDGEYSQGVIKALLNPMQYIKSCIVVPVAPPPDDSIHRPTRIHFGYYDYTVGGTGKVAMLLASSPMAYETDLITIPKHPLASTRGRYLNCQPYSEYLFHFGPWGDIPLDPMVLNRNDKIFMSIAYDLTSGLGRLVLKGNDYSGDVLFNGSAQVGVSINISQVYIDGLAQTKVVTDNVFTMAGAAVSGQIEGLATILHAATAGIQDATRLDFPVVSGLPNGGALLSYHDTYNCYLLHKYYEVVDEDIDELGRPLCAYAYISTLSGFILCSGADCQISGTADEAEKINNYMNTGFFYE